MNTQPVLIEVLSCPTEKGGGEMLSFRFFTVLMVLGLEAPGKTEPFVNISENVFPHYLFFAL